MDASTLMELADLLGKAPCIPVGLSSVNNKNLRTFLISNRDIVIIKKWSHNLILTIRTVKKRLFVFVKISACCKNCRVCSVYEQRVQLQSQVQNVTRSTFQMKNQNSKCLQDLQDLYNLGLKSLCYTSWCSLGKIQERFIKKIRKKP